MTTIHVLYEGLPLCREWPEGHRWIPVEDHAPLSMHGNSLPDPKMCSECEEIRDRVRHHDGIRDKIQGES